MRCVGLFAQPATITKMISNSAIASLYDFILTLPLFCLEREPIVLLLLIGCVLYINIRSPFLEDKKQCLNTGVV